MTDIVIVGAAAHRASASSAARSPRCLRPNSAPSSSRHCCAAASSRSRYREVILGQVLTAGSGQNPARQALDQGGTAGGRAGDDDQQGVRLRPEGRDAGGAGDSRCGDAEIVIAGGQENMSASPHVLLGSRDGFRMGDAKLIDSMIVDGLWDVYNQYHMGITAENVAKAVRHHRARSRTSSRWRSQKKADAAQKAGRSRTRSFR